MMLSPSLPMKFQSTLPAWGATTSVQCVAHSIVFQSTLPAWGATRVGRYHRPVLAISIHASRMGSDACAMLLCATFENFNPRSPRGERPYRSWYFKRRIQISIHAPRVGSDVYVASFGPRPTFQSTLPAWGATILRRRRGVHRISIHAPHVGSDASRRSALAPIRISIHAPRVGSDTSSSRTRLCPRYFNPRSPRGERLNRVQRVAHSFLFQSTLPAWGATRSLARPRCVAIISIHAPRVGSDVYVASFGPRPTFQSTLPAWGATLPAWGATLRALAARSRSWHFNPRSPRGERPFRSSPTRGSAYFNPRSPRGERLGSMRAVSVAKVFQSTLPAWGATSAARLAE